jgi:hypothetical protein
VVSWPPISSRVAIPTSSSSSGGSAAPRTRPEGRSSSGFARLPGDQPLKVTGATSAETTGTALRAGTLPPLSFGDRPSATIPAGEETTSDVALLPVAAGASLTVTLYFAAALGNN